MNAYKLANQVEMWGEDLLALNMKGGIPVVEGAKMLRQQADRIAKLEKPVKQLSDEKILALWDWDSGEILATDLLDFADAIIKEITDGNN